MSARRSRRQRALHVDVITTIADADALSEEWDALAETCSAQPFSVPGLAVPWLGHLSPGPPYIVTVRSRDGELVGLLGLHTRSLGPGRILRPLGHGLGAVSQTLVSDVGGPRGDVVEVLAEHLMTELLDSFTVLQISDHELNDPLLRVLRRRGVLRAELHDECPQVDVSSIDSAAGILAAPTRRNLRRQLRQAHRRLSGHRVEIRIATDPESVNALWTQAQSVYDAAETAQPRLHLGHDTYAPFVGDAFGRLSERGQLAVIVIMIDDRPATLDLYIRSGTIGYSILGRYHPDAAAYSPGHIGLEAGMNWAISAGLDRVDLQLGADPYKLAWSTHSHDTVQITAAAPNRLLAAQRLLHSIDIAHRSRQQLRSRFSR